MDVIAEQVERLCSRDAREGCRALRELLSVCERSNDTYPYLERFIEMTDSENSYIRTRGLLLVVANAQWDTAHKIDGALDRLLSHILDPKPISARQFIAALPKLVEAREDLRDDVVRALRQADASHYSSSMRPLVEKDIHAALTEIQGVL